MALITWYVAKNVIDWSKTEDIYSTVPHMDEITGKLCKGTVDGEHAELAFIGADNTLLEYNYHKDVIEREATINEIIEGADSRWR